MAPVIGLLRSGHNQSDIPNIFHQPYPPGHPCPDIPAWIPILDFYFHLSNLFRLSVVPGSQILNIASFS